MIMEAVSIFALIFLVDMSVPVEMDIMKLAVSVKVYLKHNLIIVIHHIMLNSLFRVFIVAICLFV